VIGRNLNYIFWLSSTLGHRFGKFCMSHFPSSFVFKIPAKNSILEWGSICQKYLACYQNPVNLLNKIGYFSNFLNTIGTIFKMTENVSEFK